eukprot:886238-Amorphochlora_amoeboformis.AAC.1
MTQKFNIAPKFQARQVYLGDDSHEKREGRKRRKKKYLRKKGRKSPSGYPPGKEMPFMMPVAAGSPQGTQIMSGEWDSDYDGELSPGSLYEWMRTDLKSQDRAVVMARIRRNQMLQERKQLVRDMRWRKLAKQTEIETQEEEGKSIRIYTCVPACILYTYMHWWQCAFKRGGSRELRRQLGN